MGFLTSPLSYCKLQDTCICNTRILIEIWVDIICYDEMLHAHILTNNSHIDVYFEYTEILFTSCDLYVFVRIA